MSKKLTLGGLIGITLAFFGSVRSVPMVAETGWHAFIYMFIAGCLFALPIALISAELSTALSDSAGPQVWVAKALGEKWGFVTSWLLWIQMFFGMVMISSTFSVLLGDTLNNTVLEKNSFVIFFVIIAVYWLVTFLNLKFDMVKIAGNYGAILGVYIPFIVILILGIMFFAKHGISPEGSLAGVTSKSFFPDFSNPGSLTIIVGVVFIFAGVEMSSLHVNEIDNPKRNYPIAVITAVILIIVFNLICGLGMANAIPKDGETELANVMQAITLYTRDLGIPDIFDNVLSFLILIGVFTSLTAWVLGPSKAMLHVAEEGALPKFFHKTDEKGDPVNLVIIQAIAVSVIATLFLIPGINVSEVFLVITVTTTLIYAVVYVLIIIAAIKLRYSEPNLPRAFRLGANGNGLMWIICVLSFVVTGAVMLISLIPPESVPQNQHLMYIIFQIVAVVLAVASALLIYRARKPEWKSDNQQSSTRKKV